MDLEALANNRVIWSISIILTILICRGRIGDAKELSWQLLATRCSCEAFERSMWLLLQLLALGSCYPQQGIWLGASSSMSTDDSAFLRLQVPTYLPTWLCTSTITINLLFPIWAHIACSARNNGSTWPASHPPSWSLTFTASHQWHWHPCITNNPLGIVYPCSINIHGIRWYI